MVEMSVVWVSANKFGYELLKETLKLKNVKVKAIITLSKSSKTVMYDGINSKQWYKFGISVYETDNLNQEKVLLRRLSPEILVVCGWRQVLSKEILNICPKGTIGFHPTLLPYGRGPAPIINTILRGDNQSGVTMFYLSEGIDDGDIIGQEKFAIRVTDHAKEVYLKVIKAGKKLIRQYLPLVIEGKSPRYSQNHAKAFIFNKPSLKDNQIDFEAESLEKIYRKIKALSKPYKGAYVEKEGKRLVIWRAELKEVKK